MSGSTTAKQSKSNSNDAIPIFLRKTYHMIDTCDKNVACWSNDGKTFIVKNTDVFEKSIIPQFFKHNKFSSFVRQLNFYGFRKIKYSDTIKINTELEAATKDFWRFRHENFVRGKPDLLVHIKRSVSTSANAAVVKASATPMAVKSMEENNVLKNEVNVLKKRIEDMTKNIDQLTDMVQKVSLQQAPETETAEVGTKRKKIQPDQPLSIRPDEALSSGSMELEDFALDEAVLPNVPLQPSVRREMSDGSKSDVSKLTDSDFVEQLFTQFEEEDALLGDIPIPDTSTSEEDNTPDEALMKKLSNALKLLPKEMQEMIVDRLVASIMGTESIEKNVKAASTLTDASKVVVAPNPIPTSPLLESRPASDHVPMNLAAATLAALLSEYGADLKKKSVEKPLPSMIPVHA